jgi:hypothetical protein
MKGRLAMAVSAVSAFAPALIGIAGLDTFANRIVALPIWLAANVICSIAAASGLTRRIENASAGSLISLFLSGFFFVFNFVVIAYMGFPSIEGLVF